MKNRGVYLVGSVPMANAEEVFTQVSAVLGPSLKRLPDGETGERLNWVGHLEKVFERNPALERTDTIFKVHPGATGWYRWRLKKGASVEDVRFDNLFYADEAKKSYAVFRRLKAQGKIPKHVRFQVDFAPAHSVLWLFTVDELHAPLDPIYNEALKREIEKVAAAIPHDELAMQFDVASAVFARLERNQPSSYGRTKQEMQETFSGILVDLGNHVPPRAELLYHLCYGDNQHKHVVEPTDMGDMVDFINRVLSRVKRSVELVHMPVPRERSDDAYFEPLKRLKLRPETELCLGLVHYTDGVEGTRRRLAAAERHVKDFSIATECGFGRRKPETLPELLRIHAEVARL
jgi:hypothetical protein